MVRQGQVSPTKKTDPLNRKSFEGNEIRGKNWDVQGNPVNQCFLKKKKIPGYWQHTAPSHFIHFQVSFILCHTYHPFQFIQKNTQHCVDRSLNSSSKIKNNCHPYPLTNLTSNIFFKHSLLCCQNGTSLETAFYKSRTLLYYNLRTCSMTSETEVI